MLPLNSTSKKIPQHRDFNFSLSDGVTIKFSSSFDSGNCSLVEQLSDTEYRIETHEDIDSSTNTGGCSKSWFYFRVQGLKGKVKFNIPRMKMLFKLAQSGSSASYRPVYSRGEDGEFTRIPSPVVLQLDDRGQAKLSFSFNFDEFSDPNDEGIYFAFSYPYSYEKNINFLDFLSNSLQDNKDIYFNKEVLTFTPHLRKIHLLTISSQDHKTNANESYIAEQLFPQRDFEYRAIKFKDNKPVILITARVHPGETPASYALEGFLKFLIDPNDLRALLLRKFFTFWVVPMLNPDGVYSGHYRMDIYNQNLNRYYQTANHFKQPAIYAMKQVIQSLVSEDRLLFYIDFHAHARKKGAFLYGNAIEDFSHQVETQLFGKLMALNDPSFEYLSCIFSKAQMKSKDRPEEPTKEGCGRVFAYQNAKLIHSYTLECGFHHGVAPQPVSLPTCINKDFVASIDGKQYGLEEEICLDNKQNTPNYFTTSSFEQTGKAVLISLLDAFEKNPYSKVGGQTNMENLRKETANELARSDRMRIEDSQAYNKAKNIESLIYGNYYSKIQGKKLFMLNEYVQWPENVKDQMTKKYTNQKQILQQPLPILSSNYQSSSQVLQTQTSQTIPSQNQQQTSSQQQLPLPMQQTQNPLFQPSPPLKNQKRVHRILSQKINQTSITQNDVGLVMPPESQEQRIIKYISENMYNYSTNKHERIPLEKGNYLSFPAAPFVQTSKLIPKNRNALQFFNQLKRPKLYGGSVHQSQNSQPDIDPLSIQATGIEQIKCKTESDRRNSASGIIPSSLSDLLSYGQQSNYQQKHKPNQNKNRKSCNESQTDIATETVPRKYKADTISDLPSTFFPVINNSLSFNPTINVLLPQNQTNTKPISQQQSFNSKAIATIIGPVSVLSTTSATASAAVNQSLILNGYNQQYKATKSRLIYSDQNLQEKFDLKKLSQLQLPQEKSGRLKQDTNNNNNNNNNNNINNLNNLNESICDSLAVLKGKIEQTKQQSSVYFLQFKDCGAISPEKIKNGKDNELKESAGGSNALSSQPAPSNFDYKAINGQHYISVNSSMTINPKNQEGINSNIYLNIKRDNSTSRQQISTPRKNLNKFPSSSHKKSSRNTPSRDIQLEQQYVHQQQQMQQLHYLNLQKKQGHTSSTEMKDNNVNTCPLPFLKNTQNRSKSQESCLNQKDNLESNEQEMTNLKMQKQSSLQGSQLKDEDTTLTMVIQKKKKLGVSKDVKHRDITPQLYSDGNFSQSRQNITSFDDSKLLDNNGDIKKSTLNPLEEQQVGTVLQQSIETKNKPRKLQYEYAKSYRKCQSVHTQDKIEDVQQLAALVFQQRKVRKEKQSIPTVIQLIDIDLEGKNKLEEKNSHSHSVKDIKKQGYVQLPRVKQVQRIFGAEIL